MSGEELQLQLNVDGYLRMNLGLQAGDMVTADARAVQGSCRLNQFQNLSIHGFTMPGAEKPLASSVGQAVGDIMSLMVGRYQTFPTTDTEAPRNTTKTNWDSGSQPWYNYAFFPVIRSYGKLRRVMTYVAFYSNFDPWAKGQRPDGVVGDGPGEQTPLGPGAEQVIPLSPPQWMQYQTTQDPVTQLSESIWIDMQYIGNDDCRLSIQASLENTRPANGSYICFFPYVVPEVFRDEGMRTYMISSTERISDAWKVSGPSLGLALAAAILGAPSVYYTGFIRYIIPEHVLNKDRTSSDPYTRVQKQINFVEFVDQIPLKAAYCATHDLPLIFPNKDEFQKPQSDKISKVVAAVAGFLPNVYTTADLEDGRPFMTRRSATPLCMVATISEMMILSSYLWIYSKRFTSIYTADIEDNADAIQMVSEDYFSTRAQKLANDAAARAVSNASWKSKFSRDPISAGQEYMDTVGQRELDKLAESEQKSEARIKRIQANSENRRVDSIRRSASTVGRMSLKSGQLSPDEIIRYRKDVMENRAINKQLKKPKLSALAVERIGKFPVSQTGAKAMRQSNPAYVARIKSAQQPTARGARIQTTRMAKNAPPPRRPIPPPGTAKLKRETRAEAQAQMKSGTFNPFEFKTGSPGMTDIERNKQVMKTEDDDGESQTELESRANVPQLASRVPRYGLDEVNEMASLYQSLARIEGSPNMTAANKMNRTAAIMQRIQQLADKGVPEPDSASSEAAGLFSSVGGRIGKGIGKIFGRGAAGARIGARAGGIVDTIASRNRGIGQRYGARLGGIVGSRFGAPSQGSAYGGMAGTYLDKALERDDYPDTSASGHYLPDTQQELSPSYSFRRN